MSYIKKSKNEELTQEILRIFLKLASVKQGLIRIVDSKTISNILRCAQNSTNGMINFNESAFFLAFALSLLQRKIV